MSASASEWKRAVKIDTALWQKENTLELAQQEEDILFDCTQEEYHTVWKDYFDMETDYAQIIAGIDAEDTYLSAAADYSKGIRILHQDLWEMIISFLISQQNNIKKNPQMYQPAM